MPLDPTVIQQLPTGADDATDVGFHVTRTLVDYGLDQVAQDHEARISFGEKKYGQRLKTNNGRDAVMDAYQELLDFLSYAMQASLEGYEGFDAYFESVATLADLVRERLPIEEEVSTEPCNKVTFVPNADGPTRDEFFQQRYGVGEDAAVPFSELEGTLLTQVDSNFTTEGAPVPFDVLGDVGTIRIEPEPVTELGEQLAAELDSFDSPLSVDISEPITAYIVGEGFEPAKTVIDSEEKMEQLEKRATA